MKNAAISATILLELHSSKPSSQPALLSVAGAAILFAIVAASALRALAQQTTFAGNAQHTAIFSTPAQHLDAILWTTPIDLDNTGAFAHYGAPLITAANTVLVPVKTTNGFRVSAFEAPTGRVKYTLTTDYILPTNSWVPVYQPVIASPSSGNRLYYAGAGGTVYYTSNLDSDTPGPPVHQCFYTNLSDYASNAAAFNNTVFINTPLTAGSNGVVFFGFRVQQTAPAPLNTTQSGFARIDPNGNAIYVLAGAAANDSGISRDSHNCAPALSNDGTTLYVAVKAPATAFYGYLLGLDTTTLATKYRVVLRDPRNGNYAGILDDSTASPTVGPDGDVFFGILGDPNSGSRGFLLHFTADLSVQKPPSGFGWDFTPVIVPANIVPDYTGTSLYLLFSKYNNYAGPDGDGVNKIALLDPNATQLDPHPTAPGLVEMREVMTAMGCTPDGEHLGIANPYAVREWCINTAAVNPATRSVFSPSEDGHIYRWDLAANSLSEVLALGPGIGSPYVPTVIGPDGAIYTINGGKLFSLGSFTNVGIGVYSSTPDLRRVVAGQSLIFTAVVTNLDPAGVAATGTVTFEDLTYNGLDAVTNIVAAAVPLTNGLASVTNSSLSAAGSYLGNHFITARYSGDPTFHPGSATLCQKVHAGATSTAINSAPGAGEQVTFTASVTPIPPGGKASGMVSFWDGAALLAQTALDTNGNSTFTASALSSASHAIAASYCSDTLFASSTGSILGTAPFLTCAFILSNEVFQISFSNVAGAPFTVLASTDMAAPSSSWSELGMATEPIPGQFQFTEVTNTVQRFYRVRSP